MIPHYEALFAQRDVPGVALCLTVVDGLTVDEALVRFDGFPARRTATLQDLMEVAGAVPFARTDLAYAVAVDDHVVLVEDNGFHGSRPDVLRRLSAGTSATSVYWNVNFTNRLSYADDGVLVAHFDWSTGEPGDPRPRALAFLERCGGVRITREHLVGAHPAAVLVPYTLFEPLAGFADLFPGEFDPVRLIGLPPTRESARSPLLPKAYRSAVEVAVDGLLPAADLAVDPSTLPGEDRERLRADLLDRARHAYRQVVEDVWDAYERDDDEPTGGGIEDLVAEQDAEAEEQAGARAVFRLATARSRLHADPLTALTQVLLNAAKADPDGESERRERVHTYLSGLATR